MGTVPASFLASLEEDLDRPIGEYFDLIAGTSTGGILAIGLALGLPAKELLHLYEERGPYIFGQDRKRKGLAGVIHRVRSGARQVIGPKHDAALLRKELKEVLGDARVGDARTRLIVPAWDADLRSVYIYKTAHHQRLDTDYKKPVLDAAMATAAAPVFYKRHKTIDDIGLLDGGVWANNPIGIATVEATTLLGWRPDSLRILSLGCVDEVYMIPEAPGIAGLGLDILKLLLDGQSRGAMGISKLITGHPHEREAIFRYSPTVPANFFSLDDTSKISRLKGLGASSARQAKPKIKAEFLQFPAEPFEPVHSLERAIA